MLFKFFYFWEYYDCFIKFFNFIEFIRKEISSLYIYNINGSFYINIF